MLILRALLKQIECIVRIFQYADRSNESLSTCQHTDIWLGDRRLHQACLTAGSL
ncbi:MULTISPECIES: hypothetical protein [Chroococcidiopsis]|uniref:hypothetical protein n=1 Tax=Chroococcidiopsis TaxID=54298 RepID=UPI001304CA89|nr:MULTISPECIES: hypothetical protein [Chroococcidiopsis]URD52348.1 hypothetical protein M5J74_10210 [Chroococcidiopsis sp. CCNUC1]